MSALTVITCDGCGARKMWRSTISASVARRMFLRADGWKTKRSAPIEYTQNVGTEYERIASYTIALDICPACVAAGKQRTTKTAII